MNAIGTLEDGMQQASDRADQINRFREEMAARQHRKLHILATRTVVVDGRIVTQYLIDAGRELGHGSCYWLGPVMPPALKIRKEAA